MHASPLTAWTYPLLGAYTLATSPQLLRIVSSFLLRSLSAAAAAALFWGWLAYAPHARALAAVLGADGLLGALGRLGALGCVLAESLSLVAFFVHKRADGLQGRLFEATLKLRGVERVSPLAPGEAARLREEAAAARAEAAAQQRRQRQERRQAASGGPGGAGGRLLGGGALASTAAKKALALLVPADGDGKAWRLGRSLALAPLKALLPPIVPLLSLLEGRDEALSLQRRYLAMKGVASREEQARVADANGLAFRSFGAAARLLGEVPVASAAFAMSNAVAAGLWAADVEQRGGGKLL
jgi:hypothetical protein